MRGGLGRGASGRLAGSEQEQAGVSSVSPAHTKDAAVMEQENKARPVWTLSKAPQLSRGLQAGIRVHVLLPLAPQIPCPATFGIYRSFILPLPRHPAPMSCLL